jgi:PAS domain S-box-containing protein
LDLPRRDLYYSALGAGSLLSIVENDWNGRMSWIDDRHSTNGRRGFWRAATPSLFGTIGVALITFAAVRLHTLSPPIDGVGSVRISLLYLILIMFVSFKAGFVSSVAVSLIAAFCFQYFFLPLSSSLGTKRAPDLVVIVTFLIAAWVIAGTVARARQLTQAQLAEGKQVEMSRQLLIDSIPALIHSNLPNGDTDFLNQRWLNYMGLSLEDVSGWKWTTTIHPEDLAGIVETWRGAIAAREPFEHESRVRRADGEYRWMLHRSVALRDEGGNIVKWYGSSVDIEDRKRAETILQHSLDQLRALAARLQTVREEERIRLAREIHDELGQALTAIKIDFTSLLRDLPEDQGSVAPRSQSILKLLDQTIQSVRRIATELRPGILDDLGLVAALEWAAEDFQTRTGTKCHISLPDEDIALDPERAAALFRTFQETLTNVARHADATQVDVRLDKENGNLILEVRDNGKSISEEQLSAKTSLGILGMRERVLVFGGTLTIGGIPGVGTTVRVLIPKSGQAAE